MEHIIGLKCIICGKEYQADEIEYVCPDHEDEGLLDVMYDYDLIGKQIKRDDLFQSAEYSMWRYKPLLPIKPGSVIPPLSIGWTPIYKIPALSKALGLKEIWIKDDGRMPTASLKDRASVIGVIKAREKDAKVITTASTGNAAAALSGICACMDQPNVIFVPENAPQAKIAQLLVFGSTVLLVEGSYDDAFDLCLLATKEYGWYNRSTGYNPYMSEGKKTAAFEICEQLGWNAPDRIFVSVGDGCIIGGLHKGLKDLFALGWIDRMPQLMGVQAEGSNYMYQAWKNHEDFFNKPPIEASTVADSICSSLPRDRIKAMAAVKETEGAFISVSDDEILHAIPAMARASGVFGEPAGATAFAGLMKALDAKIVQMDEVIVVLNTGNGLKDVAGAMKAVETTSTKAYHTQPNPTALKRVISDIDILDQAEV